LPFGQIENQTFYLSFVPCKIYQQTNADSHPFEVIQQYHSRTIQSVFARVWAV
jgi:hypothetical protein